MKKIALALSVLIVVAFKPCCIVASNRPIQINAKPKDGFYWAYYLYIPPSIKKKTFLLVIPNNTGEISNDIKVHDKAALDEVARQSGIADKLEVPLLVPVFPRPATIPKVYTHALNLYSMLTSQEDLKRLDLQLLAMVEDARNLLSRKGITIEGKILLSGFSASGMFVNRFTVLHPDKVKAAAIGSPGGWPIAPVEQDNDEKLLYPIGISNLKDISGRLFQFRGF